MKKYKIGFIYIFCMTLLFGCIYDYGVEETHFVGYSYYFSEQEGKAVDLDGTLRIGSPLPDVEISGQYKVGSFIFNNSRTISIGRHFSDQRGRYEIPIVENQTVSYGVSVRDTPFEFRHVYFEDSRPTRVIAFNRIPVFFEFVSKDPSIPISLDSLSYSIEHPLIDFNSNSITPRQSDNIVGSKTIRTEVAVNINLQLKFKFKENDPYQIFDFYSGNEERKVFSVEVE